jgi:hypothetical protein
MPDGRTGVSGPEFVEVVGAGLAPDFGGVGEFEAAVTKDRYWCKTRYKNPTRKTDEFKIAAGLRTSGVKPVPTGNGNPQGKGDRFGKRSLKRRFRV